METIVPLLQTCLWVGLVGLILRKYDEPVLGVLRALRKHLEERNAREPGFPQMSDLRPQDPEQRMEKVSLEIAEVLQAPHDATPAREAPARRQVHSRYLQASDLALRAVQAEFGVTVGRQLTAGADMGFDGVFSHEGKLNIVEVKFVSALFNEKSMKHSVDRITAAIIRYGWINVRIVLLVVSENGEGFAARIAQLRKSFAANPVPVEITAYALPELRERYGVAAEGNAPLAMSG